MAGVNAASSGGANNQVNGASKAKLPTLDELKRAYDEGLPQTLLSGLEVVMRPVRADRLLLSGNVPDILTPLVMRMIFPREEVVDATVFPDEADDQDPVDAFLYKEREKAQEAMEFIKAVDVVCEAALIDPSIIPYLSLTDRMWIFRLAFMPAEVLSTFRLQPAGDVGVVFDEQGEVQAERDAAGDGVPGKPEPADAVPA